MSYARFFILLAIIFANAHAILAQDDETRAAMGLPRQISNGAAGTMMVISGKITLEQKTKPARIPVITITIFGGGIPLDKTIATDTGHYYIAGVPRQNASMVVEVDGTEVVRQNIVAPAMGNSVMDMRIPWPQAETMLPPAVVSADHVYDRTPKNQELFESALGSIKSGDPAKGGEMLTQLVMADPKDFVAWTEVGNLLFKAGDHPKAEGAYFEAIKLKRDYFLALLNLGKLYLIDKKADNAVLVMSNAVKAAPASPDAHYYMGEAYLLAKKGSLAVVEFNEALKIAPEEKAEAHLRIASLYDAANMKAKASAEYKVFLGKRPEYAERKALEKYITDNPPK
jgi:Flp pilus assembly protein TadD